MGLVLTKTVGIRAVDELLCRTVPGPGIANEFCKSFEQGLYEVTIFFVSKYVLLTYLSGDPHPA